MVFQRRTEVPAWGQEAPARQQLWDLAAEAAEWVLIADADQLLTGDPRPLCDTQTLNAWAFRLYDLWDDREHYRSDGFWRGHEVARPWLFCPARVPAGWTPTWGVRGIHVGHAPANFPVAVGVADIAWLHLAYVRPEHRVEKLHRYRSQAHQMTEHEKAHAESIADPHPSLQVLPFAKPLKILVGGPVRKRAEILQAHLTSLAWQELPPRVQVSYAFVDDYPTDEPGRAVLAEFAQAHGAILHRSTQPDATDFSDQHPVSHQWTNTAMQRMARLKHLLFQDCVTGGYDYLWLVDSDLILDRTVLRSLVSAGRPVTSAVYWTRWNAGPDIHAGPQVWLKPPYQLALPHYPEHEFRKELALDRSLLQVGGLGACTLIHRSVIEKGVRLDKPLGFPMGGLWDGEDRHFSEWCQRLHVPLAADAWPDIFHVYHPTDLEQVPMRVAQLGQEHPRFANHGSLVSLVLKNLEDGVGPLSVRTRLGSGSLLPELEHQVLAMQRGETKIVRVHFPPTAPTVPTSAGPLALAGQIRLIQVELIDCKPFGLPPVVEDEFFLSGDVVKDSTTLTPDQSRSFQEAIA